MEYIIETKNLTKQYRTSTVVDCINLHVPKGKIYGLLGRNGAGKTTVIKMILKLVKPTAGSIQIFRTDYMGNVDNLYRNIGSIIESPGFYNNLTAKENLQIISRLRGQPNEEKVYKALEAVNLHKECTKTFAYYSLGMKQRLAIAAAIMHEPEILILDEPINGLDPIGISEIRSFLWNLNRNQGTTIFISSHVLSEIEQLADVIGIMHEGNLLEEINMIDLHKRRRRFTQFDVSNPSIAIKLLEDNYGITDYSVQGDTIKIYDSLSNRGYINKTFVENGLIVSKINTFEESLEDYLSKLIGGVDNA